jgi:hypothetical protein
MRSTHATRFLLSTLAATALSLLLTSNPARAAGPDPATKCEVAKLKAAGKKAACLATEETKVMLGKPANPAKCEAAFTKAFATAEAAAAKAGGSCTVTGDVAVIEDLVDTCVDDIASALNGVPPSPCSQFPATGQTTAYQADKNDGIVGPVAVPDDGVVQAGATLSYTDNGDGTITDNNTGLMWEKKSDDGGLHDKDNVYRWSGNGAQETIWDWLEDINAEGGTGFAGHNDWRIPNLKELQSIVNYENFNPAVSAAFDTGCVASCTVLTCSCTVASLYWSSTSRAFSPSGAWFVAFNGGFVNAGDKSVGLFVRAVRGGS